MPTYEYRCNKCGKRFDLFQKMSDRPIETCPYCKGDVTRIIGAGMGIIFKGSGFYETDYKHNGSKISSTNNQVKKTNQSDVKENTIKETTKEKKDLDK